MNEEETRKRINLQRAQARLDATTVSLLQASERLQVAMKRTQDATTHYANVQRQLALLRKRVSK